MPEWPQSEATTPELARIVGRYRTLTATFSVSAFANFAARSMASFSLALASTAFSE